MKKENGFYFNPKKWLGDAHILAMDWDCQGMHLYLMAIAWQQPLQGYLPDDEKTLRKLLRNPEEKDWNERIKPQIFAAWKKKIIKEQGTERQYWYQPGMIKTIQAAKSEDGAEEKVVAVAKKTRSSPSKKQLIEVDNPPYDGFCLEKILKAKNSTTILYETASSEDKSTIWTLGVQVVKQQGESDAKARAFLARLIKEFGDKAVAAGIAQLSLKQVSPAEVHSYLVGILKNQQQSSKKTGRGSVSL